METGRNRACKNGWGWDVGVGVWTGRAAPPPRRATTTPHPAAHHPPVTPRLQAFRQLRSARVAWVHGDERHGRRAQWDARALKLEARLAAAQGVQHRLVLGGAHRQHLQCSCEGRVGARVGGVGVWVRAGCWWAPTPTNHAPTPRAHADGDAVELVEAAPRPRLGQAAINLSHGPEVHLVRALGCGLGVRGGQAGGTGGLARALLSPCPTPPNPTPLPHVEDIALHSQGPGQIFCRLRLARPCGGRGGWGGRWACVGGRPPPPRPTSPTHPPSPVCTGRPRGRATQHQALGLGECDVASRGGKGWAHLGAWGETSRRGVARRPPLAPTSVPRRSVRGVMHRQPQLPTYS